MEAALFAPRMNRAAAVRSAREKAICTTTSGWRGMNFQRRRTTSSPACCFRSPTKLPRESFRAGPNANASVPSKQNPNVAARIEGFGPLSHTTSSGINFSNEPTKRSDDHSPRTSPPTPPRRASTKPSVRSWRTMRERLPPSARRMAISFRRAVPRANSMFAKFRHATNNTTMAMPSKSGTICVASLSFAGPVSTDVRETGVVTNVWFFCSTGNALFKFAAKPLSEGATVGGGTPGFNRPTIISCCPARSPNTVFFSES